MNLSKNIAAKLQFRNNIKEKHLVLNSENWILKKMQQKAEFLLLVKAFSKTLSAVGRILKEIIVMAEKARILGIKHGWLDRIKQTL